MDYAWQCIACASANDAGLADCVRCGCPASATLRQIEQYRMQFAAPVETPHEEAVDRSAIEAALVASSYRAWYRAALGAFVFSLLVPKATGLYMLALGFLGAQYSLAWFANPFLIAAFILARPKRDPGSSRGLAYAALVLMFVQPGDSIARFSPLPFWPWVLSALLLIIGMERYRAAMRRANKSSL